MDLMKLKQNHTKDGKKIIVEICLISLNSMKYLQFNQKTDCAGYEDVNDGRQFRIFADLLFENDKKFFQDKVIMTSKEIIKFQNEAESVEEKNTDSEIRLIILILRLSSKGFYVKKKKSIPDDRPAVISYANRGVLSTPEANMNLHLLYRSLNRMFLNFIDSLLSPIALRNLSIKGSAPVGNSKKVIADSTNLMFVVLGWSGDNPTESIEVFDANSQKWSFFQRETPFIRAYHGVALLGSKLYVVGGFNGHISLATMLCLNMRSRHWSRKCSMSISRCYVLAVSLSGRVYAIGGHSGMNRLKTCEKFDPSQNKWTPICDMMYRRSDAAGVELNGKIIVSGGFDGFQLHSTVEIYDPLSDQWTLAARMTHPRSGHCMITLDGYIYVLGGFTGTQRLREVERFSEEANAWESHTPMLIGRSNFCAVVFQQEIFVIGGYDGSSTISSVEKFDKARMCWLRAPNLNIHRSAAGACVMCNADWIPSCAIKDQVPVVSANIEGPSP